MKNLIHWFELPYNTHVSLTDACIKYLVKRRKLLNLTQVQISKLLGMSEGGFRYWETKKRSPSVKLLISWLKALKLPILFVEDKINSIYQLGSLSVTIYNPNFPFKEIPEHVALIAHGFFDGCLKKPKSGGLIYETPNLVEQKMFRNLIRSCNFGKFRIPINSRGYSTLPAPLSQLLQKHYKIASFLGRKAFFSNKLMQLAKQNKEWRKSIIRAAFIDEGSSGKTKPRDNVEIVAVSNKILALQIFELCKLQNYDISFYIDKKIKLYVVYLKADSVYKFYNDIVKPLLVYYKKSLVEILVKRNLRVKKQIEELKKHITQNKEIRVIDVQKILNITEPSARRRINRLLRENYIKKINNKYLLRRQI